MSTGVKLSIAAFAALSWLAFSTQAQANCDAEAALSPVVSRTITSAGRIAQRVHQSPAFVETLAARAGLDLKMHERPIHPKEGSADFYRIFVLVDGRVAILVGDFAGKGEHYSSYPTRAHERFDLYDPKELFAPGRTASEVMMQIDRDMKPVFEDKSKRVMFPNSDKPAPFAFALALVILDQRTGLLQYANAGMPPVRIRKTSGNVIVLDNMGWPVGGSVDELNYSDFNEGTTSSTLSPGDTVVMFSDGVEDAQDAEGNLIGKLLTRIIESAPQGRPESIVEQIQRVSQAFPDDMTALAFQYEPLSSPRP